MQIALEKAATGGTTTGILAAPLLPARRSPPVLAALHRPRPVPPAQPQSPGLPAWVGRLAT